MKANRANPGPAALRAALYLVAILGCSWASWALDPARPFYQHRLKLWTQEHGLPQGRILSLAQTHDGYLWIGTYEGLARFNGKSFKVFDRENTPEMDKNAIYSLQVDGEVTLWIGTPGGILSYREGRFRKWSFRNGSFKDELLRLCPNPQGQVWIGTPKGLAHVQGDVLDYVEGLKGQYVQALAPEPSGALWIGTREGLYYLKGSQLKHFGREDGLTDPNVRSLALDTEDQLWIGTHTGLIRKLGPSFHSIPIPDLKTPIAIHAMERDRHGGIWFSTELGGLYNIHKGQVKGPFLGGPQGILRGEINKILEDREGSLWIGSYLHGLCQLSDQNLALLEPKTGLPCRDVRCVLEDSRGALWIGGTHDGLFRFQNGKVQSYGPKEGLPNSKIRCLTEDSDGTLWIGTATGGIFTLRQDRIQPMTGMACPGQPAIRALHVDRKGRLWIASDQNGLAIARKGRIESRLSQDEALTKASVYALAEDGDGRIWAGTFQGKLHLIQDGKVTRFGPETGLPSTPIFSIWPDEEGKIWLGTADEGLLLWKDRLIGRFGRAQGLPSNKIFALHPDKQGRLWMNTSQGLVGVQRKDLLDQVSGSSAPLNLIHLGAQDALVALNGPACPPIHALKNGQLAFATGGGVAFVDPQLPYKSSYPPFVAIENLLLDGQPLSMDELQILPKTDASLVIHYSALSFLNPNRIQFRNRLEGLESAWKEMPIRHRGYTRLSPGSYTFRVQARDENGVWNPTEASVSFKILPHWHQTWTFRIFLGLAGLGLALGLHRTILNRHRLRARKLEQAVEQRTEELRIRTLELEALDRSVEAVNREFALGNLLDVLLAKAIELFPPAQKGLILMEGEQGFQVQGSMGALLDRDLCLSNTEIQSWLDQSTCLAKDLHRGGAWSALPEVADRLCISLRTHSTLMALLLLEHATNPKAFQNMDLDRLRRFRHHAVGAILKARALVQLQEALERAKASDQAKGEFLANMNHELRTPLNAILGFADLGLKQACPPRALEYFQKIASSSRLLLGLMNDILDFSKLDAGEVILDSIPFHLGDLLAQIHELLAHRAHDKQLDLRFEVADGLPPLLLGDPLHLGQILVKLLGNALKFTTQGEVHLKVAVFRPGMSDAPFHSSEPEGDPEPSIQLHFQIIDTGIGLTAEQISRLFQPFSQADTSNSRQFEGMGLGLALSQRLVHLMGGEIWVQSEVNRGSTFHFTARFALPAQLSQGEDTKDLPVSMALEEELHPLKGISLLLVEDNPINQQVAREILESVGALVDVASDGTEALEKVDVAKHRMVLMDVQMPRMDGYEATRQLRQRPGLEKLPIIAMTAHAMEGARNACLDAGMNDYLTKPIEATVLLAKVAQWGSSLKLSPEKPPADSQASTREAPSYQSEGLNGYVPSQTELPNIDLPKALKRLGGKRQTYFSILECFVEENRDFMARARHSLDAGDLEQARFLFHTLKGSAGNLSLPRIQAEAASLEQALRKGEPASLEALEQALKPILERNLQDGFQE